MKVMGTVMLVRAAQELIVRIGDCHERTNENDLRIHCVGEFLLATKGLLQEVGHHRLASAS